MSKVAGAIGAIGALYYGQVGWQVYRTTSEEKRIKSRRDAEISAGAAAQATIQKEQVRVTTLQEQLEAHAEAITSLELELEALKRQAADVENRKNTRQKEAIEAAALIEKCKQAMLDATAEIKRRKENAVVAEEALLVAHVHAKDAKQLYNPLNHPLVKSFLNK